MSKDLDNLAESLEKLYSDESTETEIKSDVEPEKKESPDEVEQENENTDKEIPEEPDSEAQDEDEKEIPEIEEDKELDRKLSGQPKEFKDLVKSVKDPELREQILGAGKILRAREDQVRLELGNTKKELVGASGLLKLLETDPALAIKHIAQAVKVDLSSLIEKKPVVEDEYDYRTPEDKARDEEFKDIKQKLSNLENQKLAEVEQSTAQQIEEFRSAEDSKGNLKYPHFERVRSNMAPFFDPKSSMFDSKMTMERAYQKAVLLDDELVSLRDSDILKQAAEKRKEEVERMKSLKKFSNRSSSAKTMPSLTPLESNKQALSQLFG